MVLSTFTSFGPAVWMRTTFFWATAGVAANAKAMAISERSERTIGTSTAAIPAICPTRPYICRTNVSTGLPPRVGTSVRLPLRLLHRRRRGPRRMEHHLRRLEVPFQRREQLAPHHDRHRRRVAFAVGIGDGVDHRAVDRAGQQHRELEAQLVG